MRPRRELSQISGRESQATVDLRSGELVICSYSQTTAGFWVANGIFRRLTPDIDDQQLGSALVHTLDATEHGIAAPAWHSLPIERVLRELGVGSYSEYMRGTRQVGVTRGENIVITPTRNGGAADGFSDLVERAETLEDSALTTVANSVRKGLELSL